MSSRTGAHLGRASKGADTTTVLPRERRCWMNMRRMLAAVVLLPGALSSTAAAQMTLVSQNRFVLATSYCGDTPVTQYAAAPDFGPFFVYFDVDSSGGSGNGYAIVAQNTTIGSGSVSGYVRASLVQAMCGFGLS